MRFPEFTGEWETKKLGDVVEIIGGGTPDTTIDEYWNGDIQWFTPSEIKSNYVSKSQRTITELGLNKSSAKLLPVGAILITTRATIGEVAIATEVCSTNQGFQSLVVNKNINNLFISNWIKQNRSELIRRAKGSTFAEISKSEIERITIQLPTEISEQNKIASFLSFLDRRIETQIKIIEDLKLLKSTLSKRLLLNESWEQFKIADIASLGRGRVISSVEISKQRNPKYPVYSSQTSSHGIMGYLDTYDFDGEYVTWTTDGANAGTVFYRNGKFNCTNVCGTLKINSNHNPYFVAFCLNLIAKKYVFVNLANPKLMNNVMANIKIHLPKIQEQNRLAKLFVSIANKIQCEASILEALREKKNYFLQQMFI